MSEVVVDVKKLAMDEIHADEEFNCRGTIQAIDVMELAKDIKANGLLQPVIVFEYDAVEQSLFKKKYKLIAGFRRFTAHMMNGATEIDAKITRHLKQEDAMVMNLAENMNRKDLTLVQEAKAIARLKEFGMSREIVSNRLGKSQGWVQIRFMLLDLPKEIWPEAEKNLIGTTDIRELYSILKTVGVDACIEAAREMKSAKERGVKISVRPKQGSTKKARKPHEIQEMMNVIYDSALGGGLHTSAMAWCCGEISDKELFDALEKEAKLLNLIFTRPY